MPRGLQERASRQLYAGEGEVDLQVALYEWDGVTKLATVGGRWSIDEHRWVGEGHTEAHWRLQPAEYEAAYFFVEWLAAKIQGKRLPGAEDVYTVMMEGGRGGGKSDFGIRAITMMALAIPDRICWDVSPVEDETDELKAAMDRILVPDWHDWMKSELTWKFWNGSEIQLLSAHNPSTLKRGRVDGFLLNEGQRMAKDAYLMARPRVADTGGLGFITANPPREAKGKWISEFHDAAIADALPGIKLFVFDNHKNPIIDWRSLELLRDEFGDDDYDREILGLFIPIGDRVFYAWLPTQAGGNIRPAPEIGNITRQITRQHLGREFDHVIGVDFQLSPHMASVTSEFFTNPVDALDPLQWFTDETVVEGDENDLVDMWEAKGYDPERTAIIADASGAWQDAERTKGRGSFDIIKARGWKYIYVPDRKLKKNPVIIERVQATNARMCSARKSDRPYRRLFSVPGNHLLNRAFREWPNKNGTPHRRSEFAHLCDAATYVVWRFFPRRVKRSRIRYKAVTPKKSRRHRDLDRF